VFDWMTWSVWLIGFAILVIWIVVPLREFREMRRRLNAEQARDTDEE
jgi:hypothetical protein